MIIKSFILQTCSGSVQERSSSKLPTWWMLNNGWKSPCGVSSGPPTRGSSSTCALPPRFGEWCSWPESRLKMERLDWTFSYNKKAFREKELWWFWLCWSLTFSVVCGDWSSINWRGSNPWGLGGGRRRAQWLCLHCKVSVIHLQEVVLIFYPKMKMFSPLGHPRFRRVCLFIWTDLEKFSVIAKVHCRTSIGEQVI